MRAATAADAFAMMVRALVGCVIVMAVDVNCAAHEWPDRWRRYADRFLDDQIRVIDRDAADRTTSEGQAYALFFSLVANDRGRFDGLLRWTTSNLASDDLATHL